VSGIGVVQNAAWIGSATVSPVTMPHIFNRTLQTRAVADYAPGQWKPAFVIMYLGSNDYVLLGPSKAKFVTAYTKLLASVLAQYPEPAPPVLHICGSGDDKHPCDYVNAVAQQTGGEYYSADPTATGCIGTAMPQSSTRYRSI